MSVVIMSSLISPTLHPKHVQVDKSAHLLTKEPNANRLNSFFHPYCSLLGKSPHFAKFVGPPLSLHDFHYCSICHFVIVSIFVAFRILFS